MDQPPLLYAQVVFAMDRVVGSLCVCVCVCVCVHVRVCVYDYMFTSCVRACIEI